GRAPGPEVLGPPLDIEHPVRSRAGRRREHTLTRTAEVIRPQIVPIREERRLHLRNRRRQTLIRKRRISRTELDVPVRDHLSRWIRLPVDVHREWERNRPRAIV